MAIHLALYSEVYMVSELLPCLLLAPVSIRSFDSFRSVFLCVPSYSVCETITELYPGEVAEAIALSEKLKSEG